MIAALGLLAFLVMVTIGLGVWITPSANADIPEFDDLDSIRRHHDRHQALARAAGTKAIQ